MHFWSTLRGALVGVALRLGRRDRLACRVLEPRKVAKHRGLGPQGVVRGERSHDRFKLVERLLRNAWDRDRELPALVRNLT